MLTMSIIIIIHPFRSDIDEHSTWLEAWRMSGELLKFIFHPSLVSLPGRQTARSKLTVSR